MGGGMPEAEATSANNKGHTAAFEHSDDIVPTPGTPRT